MIREMSDMLGVEEIRDEASEKIISDISDAIRNGRLASGSRLQSENKLTTLYNANVYSVRKAIRKLKNDGILYSVPKLGVFVAKTADVPRQEAPSRNSTETETSKENMEVSALNQNYSMHDIPKTLRFITGSYSSSQQNVWNNAISSFSKSSIAPKIEIIFQDMRDKNLEPFDICELASISDFYLEHSELLDLKEYFSDVLAFPEFMSDGYGVPFCRSVPLMFYNADLLEKMGFAPPSHSNYSNQLEYMNSVTECACRSGIRLPGTIQNVIFMLGGQLHEILEKMRSPGFTLDSMMSLYAEPFLAVTDYWKKYKISFPRMERENFTAFVNGETPLFYGWSFSMSVINERRIPFRYGAVPMYGCDDMLGNMLLLLSVNRKSTRVIDAVRFIRHLQSDEAQRNVSLTGMFPMDLKNWMRPDHLDCSLGELRFAPPALFLSPVDAYICKNILNMELWNMILFDKSLADAMRDCFFFSKAYLNMTLPSGDAGRRKEGADVFF